MRARNRLRRLAASIALITAGGVLAPTVPAAAAAPLRPARSPSVQSGARHATAARLADAKTALAQALARSLNDGAWARRLERALAGGPVDPAVLAGAPGGFAAAVRAANAAVLAAKGLPASTGSVLEVRLAGPSGGIGLVAAEVGDDALTSVTAYDRAGHAVLLSGRTAPNRAVAVVGVNERRTLSAGVGVLRAELARHGVGTGDRAGARPAAAGGFWTTRLTSIRLDDDEEPWIKGDAEIYTIVTGVGSDPEAKPQVDIVQMPWLETDGRTYYPDQIVVNWSHFKYNAVDAVMMEEDDGTNYRALAQAIASALLTILDGVQYAPMVNAILEAIPDDWWTDDPDYVDSWYVLTRQSNEWRRGARQNGAATFAPYYVSPV